MKQETAEYLAGVILGLVVVVWSVALSGCAFRVGVDWHGKTGIDQEQFTEAAIKPVRK